ncbi:Tripartite-type tricarboxylate transporter, receptor component TctC [Noviherbaspirillum humi]|uniref:Tripartite-type tricarboxylate transporter, receptor component TctC n=1 Tax=Noviherbaspirillum humi TaxID=1688639 RepID=A0A239J2Q6_9BURK|nr:tripartite tricarboxylate transporter substrate binding protein [Noviherbaspirillum humi]SNS98944.1 Tripartite-type tricarboxylate transporter, receptor component TctC [Noviherbaspirillum humi]
MDRRCILRGSLTALLAWLGPFASAADWPQRPLRLIVPFAPGSTPDLTARIIGERLARQLGQPVVLDNKPGAGGNIGTDAVAKATADGYTFGLTISGPLAANTLLYRRLPYDPARDLLPVSIAASQPSVLVTGPGMDAAEMADLLARLRAHPGRYNYASLGTGSISHLAMEALAARSGTEVVHVPYAGSPQAVSSLMMGDTQLAVLPVAAVMAQVRAGKLKALAVATARRSPLLPELPTLAEAGLENVHADAWTGFILPAKTPPAIAARLQSEIAQALQSPEVRQKLQAQWMEPVGSTPEVFKAILQADLARWQAIIRKNGITLD